MLLSAHRTLHARWRAEEAVEGIAVADDTGREVRAGRRAAGHDHVLRGQGTHSYGAILQGSPSRL